ncbi:CsiV family protein [uncultured Alcanivorax sp.]|nr:CsiV family protein [uncultured Alcanivorax sp.]
MDISESRRLSGFQAYYFDHPMFGMIVRVTR